MDNGGDSWQEKYFHTLPKSVKHYLNRMCTTKNGTNVRANVEANPSKKTCAWHEFTTFQWWQRWKRSRRRHFTASAPHYFENTPNHDAMEKHVILDKTNFTRFKTMFNNTWNGICMTRGGTGFSCQCRINPFKKTCAWHEFTTFQWGENKPRSMRRHSTAPGPHYFENTPNHDVTEYDGNLWQENYPTPSQTVFNNTKNRICTTRGGTGFPASVESTPSKKMFLTRIYHLPTRKIFKKHPWDDVLLFLDLFARKTCKTGP